jgi:hypothetical protein
VNYDGSFFITGIILTFKGTGAIQQQILGHAEKNVENLEVLVTNQDI